MDIHFSAETDSFIALIEFGATSDKDLTLADLQTADLSLANLSDASLLEVIMVATKLVDPIYVVWNYLERIFHKQI